MCYSNWTVLSTRRHCAHLLTERCKLRGNKTTTQTLDCNAVIRADSVLAERKTKETNGVFAKIRLYKFTCLPPNKVSCLPTKLLVCTLSKEVNKILQAPPSKLRPEMGMCVTTIYVQQQQYYYTIRVLIVRTPLSNLSFQAQHIPGNWYGTCKHPTDYTIR